MTKYYTTSQVAKVCNVHRNTIIGAIRKGLLKIHRTPGGHARISQEDLDDFCHRRSLPTTALISRNNRVLVLDPDAKFADTLAEAMKDYDYQVEIAKDPFNAGYLLGNFRPNAVILETQVGDITGASICRAIRSMPKLRDTAIVGISKQDEVAVDELLESGADDFVAKPFSVEELIERVVNLIGPVVLGTSGRATTGKISGKIDKSASGSKKSKKTGKDKSTRKATRKSTPRNPNRTTRDGVLASPEDEFDDEDF